MNRKFMPAGAVILFSSVLISCFPFYRYQSAACKQRGASYNARVEKLGRDAREKLTIGTNKEALTRFFEQNGIPVTFARGEATGTISTTGCAPAGCGSDAAYLGLKVKVDDSGSVIGEPIVGALYADCL